MAGCVLSSGNRFYAAREAEFGQAAAPSASHRFAGFGLGIRQRTETPRRRDKTGGRTFGGVAPGARRFTDFELSAYPTRRPSGATIPGLGALVEAAMGAAPAVFTGGVAAGGSSATQIVFASAHGLAKGQAFGFNGEIRFVKTVVNTTTVVVNAPFSAAPAGGSALTGAVTYFLADELPGASVYDYWDPAEAVNRLLIGAAVGRMRVRVNADFHELGFQGEARDVLDSVSFVAGQGGLGSFPAEPALGGAGSVPIPGNLGQAWLGASATRFLTVSAALVEIDNDLDLRSREFGAAGAVCSAPGLRRVSLDLELYEKTDEATRGLYGAARSETPVEAMFQLGEGEGATVGVYLPQVVPQVPLFDDGERVLRWRFAGSRAQGVANDEIVVAFG